MRDVRLRLRAAGGPDSVGGFVCLVDAAQRPRGLVTAQALLVLDEDRPVGEAPLHPLPQVGADTDQERVASLALHHEVPAVAVVGDGSFLMTPHVLATAAEYDIPAVWVVWNNYGYCSIRDLQLGLFKTGELATSFAS